MSSYTECFIAGVTSANPKACNTSVSYLFLFMFSLNHNIISNHFNQQLLRTEVFHINFHSKPVLITGNLKRK